jgi:hypothetical protein
VGDDRFGDLIPYAHDWIQSCHRLLKDHGDRGSAEAPHLRLRKLQQIAG